MSVRMPSGASLLLAYVAVSAMLALLASSQSLPSEISYYVTVRDFIAAPCRLPLTAALEDFCPTTEITRVNNNEISGHPDFQRVSDPTAYPNRNAVVGRYSSKYAKFGQAFPVTYDDTAASGSGRSHPFVFSDLAYDTAGIPKMQFCGSGIEGHACDYNDTRGRSVGDASTFSTWYQDAPRFSRRLGYKQKLFLTTGSNQYDFDSDNNVHDPLSDNFFNPIGDNGLVGGWPLSKEERDEDAGNAKKFWFSVEIHNFFQYRGGESFTFSGDDDVHVYINNRLALNLGGLHGPLGATLNVTRFERELGITRGGVYQFDLFHAERQLTQSNFRVQTTLSSSCNVITTDFRTNGRDVGTPIDWRANGGATNNSQWVFISGPGFGFIEPSSRVARLMRAGIPEVVSYMFFREQQNIGSGFSLSFKFRASGAGHGFALVMHNRLQGLKNFNGGSGPNLGIRNTDNSIAILFDMCPGFPTCGGSTSQIRMHYKTTGDRLNSPFNATRTVHDLNVYQNWADGLNHTVEVFYYAIPDWFEVYVDNSLRLVQRGFSPQAVLGGRDAFVGFSSASSNAGNGMDVRIFDVTMKTVKVIPTLTRTDEDVSSFPKQFTANGRELVSFALRTRDACENDVDFGGLSSLVQARLVATSISDAPPSSGRRLQQGGSLELLPDIVDTEDGRYEVRFKTDVLATFTLHMAFGTNCTWNGVSYAPFTTSFNATNNRTTITYLNSSSTCFFATYPNAATSIPFTTFAPTSAEAPSGLGTAALAGVGVAAGVVMVCGSIMLFIGVRVRNRWRRDKKFIEEGERIVAERNVAYVGDSELDMLQNKLQLTLHALNAERAKKFKEDDKQHLIDELLRQKGELQEMVRRQKIMKAGGDPNAMDDRPTIASRVRKSFAASRVSRGASLFNPTAGEASASNPLFTRLRQSISRPNSRAQAAVIHENPGV